MTESKTRLAEAVGRVLTAFLILALVAGLVLLLSSVGVPMTDAKGTRNYGAFVIFLAAALVFTRILDLLLFDLGFRLRRGTPAPALLRQIVSLLVFGIILAILCQVILSASLPALLTTSAIITAVIGLALQETLGNLFSGVALALERTVQVGDMVRAGETIGLVEQLSWRAIKVRAMEGHAIVIPNSVASRDRLEVFRRGGAPMARTLAVGLEYAAPPARARAALEAAARDAPGVAKLPSPVAYLARFDSSAVVYELRYWLEDYARYLEIDSKVRERVWYRLEREGLPIAYPVIRQHQYAAGPLPRRLETEAIPAVIEASDLFAPLSASERGELAAGVRQHRYSEGEIVVREGDTTSSMFLIVEGRVGISVHGEGVASQKIAFLEPGAAFGEISLLTGEPRLATARALTEATLIEIDKATIAPILEANPSLVAKLDAIIQERRRHTANRLVSTREGSVPVEPESLRARIARFFGLKGLA
ncbi:MAG TPA: mechanosensitive ion channel family protein [Thermoanaerobaculia bacterium]|jgi:small-conductance mechanosensitive channel/CRP-like cAMP-binding protein